MSYPLPLFRVECTVNIDENISKIKTVLDEIQEVIDTPVDELYNDEDINFVFSMKKNTTTPSVRTNRCNYILNKFIEAFTK